MNDSPPQVAKLVEREEQSTILVKSADDNSHLWQLSLRHLNRLRMRQLIGLTDGHNLNRCDGKPCTNCLEEKHSRPSSKSSKTRSNQVLESVHSDLCGSMEVKSFSKPRYVLTVVGDFTSCMFIYFLESVDEVIEFFRELKSMVESQTEK